MPTRVIMPQMGESIVEGTIVRWFKKVGDPVEKDETLFEISTDKVDAEIPSPASGVLLEILAGDGQTVAVDTVVGHIGAAGEAPVAVAAPAATPGAVPTAAAPSGGPPTPAAAVEAPAPPSGPPTQEDLRRTRSSPLVRKIAREQGIDLSGLRGTGLSGRVTKKDLATFLEARAALPATPAPVTTPPAAAPPPAAPAAAKAPARPAPAPEGVRVEPFSPMRRAIAHHMVASRDTSVHVTTVFEVDMTRVARLRKKHREAWASRGVNLTFMPFIMKAVAQALQEHPKLNSSVGEDAILYHPSVNLGVAVALDWGLLVPVVKSAEEKSLLGLAKAVHDLAGRARSKKLSPDEVQGGTFTITNPGVFGSLFGTPIINQPQVAILCVGAIKKRVVVIDEEDETIGVRSMAIFSLSFDHRVVDGADSDRFMARVKQILEEFPEEAL